MQYFPSSMPYECSAPTSKSVCRWILTEQLQSCYHSYIHTHLPYLKQKLQVIDGQFPSSFLGSGKNIQKIVLSRPFVMLFSYFNPNHRKKWTRNVNDFKAKIPLNHVSFLWEKATTVDQITKTAKPSAVIFEVYACIWILMLVKKY